MRGMPEMEANNVKTKQVALASRRGAKDLPSPRSPSFTLLFGGSKEREEAEKKGEPTDGDLMEQHAGKQFSAEAWGWNDAECGTYNVPGFSRF